MSDADATDPVMKALREFTALSEAARHATTADMQRMAEHQKASGFGRHATALDLARAALSAAPALLARIEAGERAIAGARCWVASAASHDEDARKDLVVIDAFLAGKEAPRG